jgi:hypothetical protein
VTPPATDSSQVRREIALDLARKATDLQCAVVGRVNARVTDTPPTVGQLCAEIISKADILRRAA